MSACAASAISPMSKPRAHSTAPSLISCAKQCRERKPQASAAMHDPLASHQRDAPIFDPAAFRLTPPQAELIDKARRFGQRVLAPRAARYDREASFPIENFRDMHPEGLLAVCIPKAEGGLGADFLTYCIAAAELGRYCG